MIKKYIIESLKYILRSQLFVTRYVKEIEALYQMSPNELRARNEKCFLKLFNRAYDNSSFYKKLYSDAGIKKDDIKCLEDIKKLPIITKFSNIKVGATLDSTLTVITLDTCFSL